MKLPTEKLNQDSVQLPKNGVKFYHPEDHPDFIREELKSDPLWGDVLKYWSKDEQAIYWAIASGYTVGTGIVSDMSTVGFNVDDPTDKENPFCPDQDNHDLCPEKKLNRWTVPKAIGVELPCDKLSFQKHLVDSLNEYSSNFKDSSYPYHHPWNVEQLTLESTEYNGRKRVAAPNDMPLVDALLNRIDPQSDNVKDNLWTMLFKTYKINYGYNPGDKPKDEEKTLIGEIIDLLKRMKGEVTTIKEMDPNTPEHWVQIVGLIASIEKVDGSEEVVYYWKVRNTHGEEWGYRGYVLMEAGINLAGIDGFARIVEIAEGQEDSEKIKINSAQKTERKTSKKRLREKNVK